MREVDAALDLMRKDYKKRMEECESRRLQFEERQSKMREQVIKFEKFIQENDAKRLRAEAKAKHERQQFVEKCKELNALQQQLQDLELSKEELCSELGERATVNRHLYLHSRLTPTTSCLCFFTLSASRYIPQTHTHRA